MALRVSVDILPICIFNHEIAATFCKFFHPSRKLNALIDRLPKMVKFCFPEQCFRLVWSWNRESDALGFWAFFFPEVDPEVAFVLQ